MDKTYVMAYAVIPEEYTSAANIIRRKNGTKVSCELVINELSYNAKEKYLDLTDFIFGGCTLLGCDEEGNEIGEGMLGARADITDFCHKEPIFTYQDKLIEVLDKLNITLSNFNISKSEEEGGKNEMTKFEELLEQYGFTADELDFDHEGMTDEELESAFEDYACRKKKCAEENNDTSASEDGDKPVATEENACGGKKKKCSDDDKSEEDDKSVATEDNACGGKKKKCSEDEESEDEETEIKEQEACGKKKKCSVNEFGDVTLEYELSHDDIRSGLYNLLSAESEDDCGWTWIVEVFDGKFIYQDYEENKYYRRSYTIDGDNISLSDAKTEVFNEWLSQSEKDALDALKQNYANLKAFKENYDAAELNVKKDEIFARTEYSVLSDDESFKALIADADKYSVEECETKADVIFAKYCKTHSDFAANTEIKKTPKVIGVPFNKKELAKKPYGNLFNK